MLLILLEFLLVSSVYAYDKTIPPTTEALKTVKLPPCSACKTFIGSFQKGIERTARGKYEGGDADWEEKKLSAYNRSEVRLIEIQEQLCKELTQGQDQCLQIAEDSEQLLETWWLEGQSEHPDLVQWLCVEQRKECCPPNHYGPDCSPCAGYPDKVCFNNGKCKGAGTRKGNGKCSCDTGYSGELCDSCAGGYYKAYGDANKLICSQCHISCLDKCTEAGPKGCEKCAQGWKLHETLGCIDINECIVDNPCTSDQFCVNNDGSYVCLACDRACQGCTGDGPDMCIACGKKFIKKDNMCVDNSEDNRNAHINFTRYLTYLGMCLATFIILQRSVIVASLVGLTVAIYISVSEYMLTTGSAGRNPTTFDAASLFEM